MRCESCGADLSPTKKLYLTLVGDRSTVQCPACNYVMAVVYNRRWQMWEGARQRDERRSKWKRGGK